MNPRDAFRWDNTSSVRNHLRRRAHRQRRGPRPPPLRIEFLEDRRMLAAPQLLKNINTGTAESFQ